MVNPAPAACHLPEPASPSVPRAALRTSGGWTVQHSHTCTCVRMHAQLTCAGTVVERTISDALLGFWQAVIALVQLYKALTFKLDPERHPVPGELELRSGITLAPKDGVWVTAHAR